MMRQPGKPMARPSSAPVEARGLGRQPRWETSPARGSGLLEGDLPHRRGQGREQVFVVGSFVRRPGHRLGLHDRLGGTDQCRGAVELAAFRGDGRQAADGERGRELGPVRCSISSASRARASAASRSPSWRSTMLRLQASDPIRNSLPVARTSASRWVIHSRASTRSPAIWAPTPSRWSALERPASSPAASLTASASPASRRPSATSVRRATREVRRVPARSAAHRPGCGPSRAPGRKAPPRARRRPSRTA